MPLFTKKGSKASTKSSTASTTKSTSGPKYQLASEVVKDQKAKKRLQEVESALSKSTAYKDCQVWVDKNSKTVMISKQRPLTSESTEDSAGQVVFESSKFDDDKKWDTLAGLVSSGGFKGSDLNATDWSAGW